MPVGGDCAEPAGGAGQHLQLHSVASGPGA